MDFHGAAVDVLILGGGSPTAAVQMAAGASLHVVVVNKHSPYVEQTSVYSRYILSARSVNIVISRLTHDRA